MVEVVEVEDSNTSSGRWWWWCFRVNVASLVTVLQMGRMEYLTEVMRCLMLRLVANAAATKHPQLMLRRTESVVEKMLTNWMALCMYNYLKVRDGDGSGGRELE